MDEIEILKRKDDKYTWSLSRNGKLQTAPMMTYATADAAYEAAVDYAKKEWKDVEFTRSDKSL
ncbi:MAG: hypothetical protein ABI867_09685 [Kofleriaceae bacterium]